MQVSCWSVPLDVSRRVQEVAWNCLDAAEQDKAGRFHWERHRRRFVVRRAARRWILGSVAGVHPKDVRFKESESGKPRTSGEDPRLADWHFSASHSEEWALVAITKWGPLGVDLEVHRELESGLWEVRNAFSERERAALERAPAGDRVGRFFDCWTRKEACVKADGAGLGISVDAFEVPIGAIATAVRVDLKPGTGKCGSVVTLLPTNDAVASAISAPVSASLAVRGVFPVGCPSAIAVAQWDWERILREGPSFSGSESASGS